MPPELQKAQQRKLSESGEAEFSLYDEHLQLDKFDQNLTSSRSKSIVVLEETYQKKILSLIHKTMNTSEISTPELDDKSWNIENNDDFKYGHRIGFLFGIVIGDYMKTYDKFPPEEDLFEIRDMLRSKIDEIKSSVLDQYFYYR